MNIQYRFLKENNLEHLHQLFNLYNEVFQTAHQPPKEEYLSNLLKNKNVLFLAACFENKVIAGLTAYILPSIYSEKNELYIYDVAVHPDFRRKGIAAHSVSIISKWCISNNISEVFVDALVEDKDAIDFYTATGGTPSNVIHFTYTGKK